MEGPARESGNPDVGTTWFLPCGTRGKLRGFLIGRTGISVMLPRRLMG